MKREQVLRKLRKLYELKNRGVGGEKINAQALYDKLCAQYKITSDELDEEKTVEHALVVPEYYNERLLCQLVACRTKGKTRVLDSRKKIPSKDRKLMDELYGVKGWNILVVCTEAEFIQVMFEYDIYKKDLLAELDSFLYGFFRTNDLLIDNPEDAPKKELSDEERTMVMKGIAYSMNMSKTKIQKQLEKK